MSTSWRPWTRRTPTITSATYRGAMIDETQVDEQTGFVLWSGNITHPLRKSFSSMWGSTHGKWVAFQLSQKSLQEGHTRSRLKSGG